MFGIETEINFILCSFMWLDWELGIKIHCYENQILLSLGLWFLSATWHYESPPFPFLFTLAKRSTNVLCISLSYTIMFIHTKYQPKLGIQNLRLKLLITFLSFFFFPYPGNQTEHEQKGNLIREKNSDPITNIPKCQSKPWTISRKPKTRWIEQDQIWEPDWKP